MSKLQKNHVIEYIIYISHFNVNISSLINSVAALTNALLR